MADEEAFFVVVGVDEPAGDAFGAVGADFAGVGVEYVHAVGFDLYFSTIGIEDVDVGFAEDDELLLPVFLRSSAMCRPTFMRALSM